ncbi:Uncharacterised protein [Klebsiella pneumoniae]|nr:Uncharacterised protein [Klebsiella pneumoniae]
MTLSSNVKRPQLVSGSIKELTLKVVFLNR